MLSSFRRIISWTEGAFEMQADITENEDFSIIIDKGMQILYDAGAVCPFPFLLTGPGM